MKQRRIIAVILIIGAVFWFLSSKKNGEDFQQKQAIQSALFPELGAVLQGANVQPAYVIFKPEAFGIVLNIMGTMGGHAEREDLRARVMVAAREWAKTRPELQNLHVFVQYSDEVDSAK
jgi:hypothetical protein